MEIWKLTPQQHRKNVVRAIMRDMECGRGEAERMVSSEQTDAQWADAVKQALQDGHRITPEALDSLIAFTGDGYVFEHKIAA